MQYAGILAELWMSLSAFVLGKGSLWL